MNMKYAKAGLALATAFFCSFAFAQQPIAVTVDGQPVTFPAAQPIEQDGRVLVPLRGVFESMGADVHWNGASQTVTAQKGSTVVRLQIGDRRAEVNGHPVRLDVPAELYQDSTMVPLRFVSEALGADVNWNNGSDTVAIVIGNESPGRNLHYGPPPTRSAPPPARAMHVFRANMAMPVVLDQSLSSDQSSQGESFSATLDTQGANSYAGLPAGTKFLGHVAVVQPRMGDRPGRLALAFDQIQLPDGRTIPIGGHIQQFERRNARNAYLPSGTVLTIRVEREFTYR